MVRPRVCRRLRFCPRICYFKPRGIPLRSLREVILRADELEAVKLHDYDGLNQTEAAGKMAISQPTFARILNRAYRKIAQALIMGQAIKIEKKR